LRNKYTEEQIQFIIQEKSKPDGLSSRKIASQLGLSKSGVNDCWNRVKGLVDSDKESGPKILLFDLETAPEVYMGFGRYKQNIQEDFVLQEGYMLSFVAKWLGDDKAVSVGLPYYKDTYVPMKPCDEKLVKDLHNLLDEADMCIAHNLKGFDWKVANTRFIKYGLKPVSPTKLIDTLNIAKANFKFPTNRLDTIARYLGVGQKLPHTGAKLWRDCVEGCEDAWKMMIDYNYVDVEVLEEVYMKLRPYDRRHPNLALYYPEPDERCICCGSKNLEITDKKAYTSVSSFEVYQCQDCGKHNRKRVNLLEKDKKDSLFMNCL